MSKQSLGIAKLESTVSALLLSRNRHDTILFIILLLMLLSLTPVLAFWGVSIGVAAVIAVLVSPMVAVVVICWPELGLYVLAFCAFVVESDSLPTHNGTDNLYVFFWPPQMQGFFERPIGLVMLLTLFIWICHRLVKRQPLLQGGALIGPFTLYILCAIGAVVYGLLTGGSLQIIILQFRPFWYTFLSYILAYNFVKRKSDIRNFFWLVIVCAGFKGLQGLYVYLILYHGDLSSHDTIMSHEESFFYASLLLLLAIFCLYYRYRPQLIACLCAAPPVLISLVANQRRTDYIALVLGIAFAWVIVFLLRPKARRGLLTGMVICASLSITYVIVGINVAGAFGSPARSIIGVFNPSAGDRYALSNLYREYEDEDLKYTAKHHPLGLGFGKEFDQPQPLTSVFPDILAQDPVYNYIPHNTIYWVWADLGIVGFFALWFLIGSIMVRGCFIARQLRDPYLQVIAIYIVTVTVMEVVVAFADYQLYFFRNVIDLGLLAGLLVKLPLLDEEQEENLGGDLRTTDPLRSSAPLQLEENSTYESTNGVSVLSQPIVGRVHA